MPVFHTHQSDTTGARSVVARLQASLTTLRAHHGAGEDFERFEREVHTLFVDAEREVLGEELDRWDVDLPSVVIGGHVHHRVLRSAETYTSAAGPVTVMRTLYRRGKNRSVVPLEMRAGMIEGHWTPLAARQAMWVVAHLTPGEGEGLFAELGNMQPSKSSLDRLPKRVSARWEVGREAFDASLRAQVAMPAQAVTVAVSLDGVMTPMKDGERLRTRARQRADGKRTKGPAGYREVGCGTRLKRDLLRRSSIGALFTRRSVSTRGPGSNETFGLDATFGFYDNLSINTYWAKTRTSALQDDISYRARLDYNGDRTYGVQAEHLVVGTDFNPEVGFLRRDDFERSGGSFRFSPRPRSIAAIRKLSWEGRFDYVTDRAGVVETRQAEGRFGMEFENSDRFNLTYTRSYEFLDEPFQIAPDATIPVGGYSFQDVRASYQLGIAATAGRGTGRPARELLQRGQNQRRSHAWPPRADSSAVGRAGRVVQLDRPPRRPFHDWADHRADDLHRDAVDVRQRPAAVQFQQRFVEHEPPAAVGVSTGQRAFCRVQRAARHIGAQRSGAQQPCPGRQDHPALSILTAVNDCGPGARILMAACRWSRAAAHTGHRTPVWRNLQEPGQRRSRRRHWAQPVDHSAHTDRRLEDRADPDAQRQPVPADRAEPGRGRASAVGAIGVAPELAGADPAAKICGDAAGHLREDALFGRRRWVA